MVRAISGKGLFLFWIFIFSLMPIYAKVTARVNERVILSGEAVDMSIEAEGVSVRFPLINHIGKYHVTAEATQRFETAGDKARNIKWVRHYTFTPLRSITIPSFEVFVDTKKEMTKPIFIDVKNNQIQRPDDFILQIKTNKKDVYQGEMIDLDIIFKEHRRVPVMDIDFLPPKFNNFLVKPISNSLHYVKDNYFVHEKHYLCFAQKSGELTLGPVVTKVAIVKKMRDMFGSIVQRPVWLTLKSNRIDLNVLPVAKGINLIGMFKLHVKVLKKTVYKGKPVNLEIRIEGNGNIEDFDPPKPHIEGATIYGDAPKISWSYENGIYHTVWENRYVLIADKSFVIPSMTLKFFNPILKKIDIIKSDPIPVEIIGNGVMPSNKQINSYSKKFYNIKEWFCVLLAFILGMAAILIWIYLVQKRDKKNLNIKKIDSGTEMLRQLLPYISTSKEAAIMAERLFAKIFENKEIKIDKRAFKKLLESLS